jgi:site-specific DNA-methyltransferase (adenine-specific)
MRVYLDGCFRVIVDRNKPHQAVKPLRLMEQLVTIASAGGLVVDPFTRSGTTCIAALRLGRRAIGMELNAKLAELARERGRADLSGSNYGARTPGQRASSE